jgi:hypothetical protein
MISNAEFQTLKRDLIDRDAVTKTVTLTQLDVTPGGVKDGYIKIQGQTVPVSNGFWSKLAKTVNVNSSLASSFMKNDDEALYATLIKAIKQYKSIHVNKAQEEYQLIADPKNREVINIIKGGTGGRLSMATICDITENILSDNPLINLESASNRAGVTQFNFINSNSIAFPDAGPDEEFKFGFSINTTPTTTNLELYNHRLVCTNGMRVNLGRGTVAKELGNISETFNLRSLKPGNIEQFLNNIKGLNANGFIPTGFKETLLRTQDTKASFGELEFAIATIMNELPDSESAKDYRQLVNSYFPAYGMAVDRIKRTGLDIYSMNDRQKSNIRTGMSVWDVINNLTFLGSNKSEFQIGNREGLKSQGGKLFNKAMTTGLDLQYIALQSI